MNCFASLSYEMLLSLLQALFLSINGVFALTGSLVPITVRPFHVSIYLNIPLQPWCGGSIVSKRSVLTVAHCFMDKTADELVIRVGSDNLVEETDSSHWYNVLKHIQHESFNIEQSVRWSNDIAIMITVKDIVFGATVQPIPLSTESPVDSDIAFVSAYTVPRPIVSENATTLEVRNLQTWNRDHCQQLLNDVVTEFPTVGVKQFCALDPQGTKDGCILDGGGPITTTITGGELLGIASWEPGCTDPGGMTFYTNVASYVDWVQDNTKEFE